MKTLNDYLAESEEKYSNPVPGDNFAIEVDDVCLLETYVTDVDGDSIILGSDDRLMYLLEKHNLLEDEQVVDEEIKRYGAVGSSPGMGYTLGEKRDTHCSAKCCGADVKAEDCGCPPDCPHCNCNAVTEAAEKASCGCDSSCSHCGGKHTMNEIGKKCSCCDNEIKAVAVEGSERTNEAKSCGCTKED